MEMMMMLSVCQFSDIWSSEGGAFLACLNEITFARVP
jgi:hypothetical protein